MLIKCVRQPITEYKKLIRVVLINAGLIKLSDSKKYSLFPKRKLMDFEIAEYY